MAKVFFGVPIFNLVNPRVFENQHKIIRESTNQIIYSQVVGASVENARQILIDRFLQTDCDYYLTADADIYFLDKENPIDRFVYLMETKKLDILGGLYVYKREPFLPVFRPQELQNLYEEKGEFPENYKFNIPNELFEVTWVGNGFKIVKRKIIEELKKQIKLPNLPMIYKNEYVSEDWAFDQRAKEMGYKVWIDPKVKLGHLGTKIYTVEDYQ